MQFIEPAFSNYLNPSLSVTEKSSTLYGVLRRNQADESDLGIGLKVNPK